jgi:hypothetical protein
MANVVKNGEKQGRVVRRYRNSIPIEEFPKWQDLIRTKAKGCGLYALYLDEHLMYVGLATKSIRSRIHTHMGDRNKPFRVKRGQIGTYGQLRIYLCGQRG